MDQCSRQANARIDFPVSTKQAGYVRSDVTKLGAVNTTDNNGYYVQFVEIGIHGNGKKIHCFAAPSKAPQPHRPQGRGQYQFITVSRPRRLSTF